MNLNDLRYPIGADELPENITQAHINAWTSTIAEFPEQVDALVKELSPKELAYHYRPEGWNIKQVVHHCADSHMNALTRFKLSLTEDKPVIKPYMEARWALLSDSLDDDLTASMQILQGIHSRWAGCIEGMQPDDFERGYIHPEQNALVPLRQALGHYDWHCRHHLEHIKQALKFKNEFTLL